MKKTIWVMWKPGEERVYAMPVQPPEPWATTQKNDGYFIASFDVELPDPTVSPVQVGPLKLQVDEGVATGIASIMAFSVEEAALRRPDVVIPAHGASDGLVGLCGELRIHRNGDVWSKGIKIAKITKDNPELGYIVFLDYCEPSLHVQLHRAADWWFEVFGRGTLG